MEANSRFLDETINMMSKSYELLFESYLKVYLTRRSLGEDFRYGLQVLYLGSPRGSH